MNDSIKKSDSPYTHSTELFQTKPGSSSAPVEVVDFLSTARSNSQLWHSSHSKKRSRDKKHDTEHVDESWQDLEKQHDAADTVSISNDETANSKDNCRTPTRRRSTNIASRDADITHRFAELDCDGYVASSSNPQNCVSIMESSTKSKKLKRSAENRDDSQKISSEMSKENTAENNTSSEVVNDVRSVAAILRNEIQQPYNPRAGKEIFVNGIRNRRDHLNRDIETGPYTSEEHNILKTSLKDYFTKHGWDDAERWQNVLAFGEGTGRTGKRKAIADEKHWETIAMALPKRPVRSVQLYAHRRLYPWKTGKWTPDEERELVELVTRYGGQWTRFAYEYFHRAPNHIHTKWKDLEPRVNQKLSLRRVNRHVWTKEEDIQLLTTIRLVTGVPLPYRAIPWSEVQRHMPSFILAGKYKGARGKVLLRQFLRYVRRGLEAGVLTNISDIEVQRIVPFWYSAGHIRRMTQYLRTKCPDEIQAAPLAKQIEFMYKLEKCDEKEQHDLRRLARSFRALQEINGVVLLPEESGILSQRFKNPVPRSDAMINSKSQNYSVPRTDVNENKFATRLFKKVDSASSKSLESVIPRPLTATEDKTKSVVPSHMEQVPEAFALYLETAHRREKKKAEHAKSKAREDRAVKASKQKKGSVNYLDYHLYDSLGLLNGDKFKQYDVLVEENDATNSASGDKPTQLTRKTEIDMENYIGAVNHINKLAAEVSDSDSSSDADDDEFTSPIRRSKNNKRTLSTKKILHVGDKKLIKKNHPWMLTEAE